MEGTSIEHELVPIITSEIGVYGMFFIFLLSDFDHLSSSVSFEFLRTTSFFLVGLQSQYLISSGLIQI